MVERRLKREGVRTKTRNGSDDLKLCGGRNKRRLMMGSAQFCSSLHHHRESVSSHQFKSQKMRGERGRLGTTSMKTRVNLSVYFFNLRFHESRIERMPGYVSIQTYTFALSLVSYASLQQWLHSNTEPIIKYPRNTN